MYSLNDVQLFSESKVYLVIKFLRSLVSSVVYVPELLSNLVSTRQSRNYAEEYISVKLLLPVYISAKNKTESTSSTREVDKN